MQSIIKFCASVFVALGIELVTISIPIGIWALAHVRSADTHAVTTLNAGLIIVLGGVVVGALITLVGGIAYLLVRIDERLEHSWRVQHSSRGGEVVQRTAVDHPMFAEHA